MIIRCAKCDLWFEDVYRDTSCPHTAFPANDGDNNFVVHDDAYLSVETPSAELIFGAHR
jgi:hypothetical protein